MTERNGPRNGPHRGAGGRRRAAIPPAVLALVLAVGAEGTLPAAAQSEGEVFQARALLAPPEETVLSSQMSGRITMIAVDEGDRIVKDQVLAAFDCTIQKAQLRKAEADLAVARTAQAVNRKLAGMNATSRVEQQLADANAVKGEAEVDVLRATAAMCELRAPFAGRVAARKAEPHQNVSQGQPLLEIFSESGLEVRLVLPSRWLAWLRVGRPFVLSVEETGRDYAAAITKLGARIDPASQTLRVVATVTDDPSDLIAGMSGTATFGLGEP